MLALLPAVIGDTPHPTPPPLGVGTGGGGWLPLLRAGWVSWRCVLPTLPGDTGACSLYLYRQ